jgi:hypothetical protein
MADSKNLYLHERRQRMQEKSRAGAAIIPDSGRTALASVPHLKHHRHLTAKTSFLV